MKCTYRDSYFESDEFYRTSLHCLSAIQIPLHILGAFIIIMKTPKAMGKVKLSMLLLHMFSAWFDIFMSILCIPVFFFPITSGYCLGLLYFLGVPNWFLAYLGFASLFVLGATIVMFFENRYNYLVRTDSETPSRKIKRAVHYFVNYSLAITMIMPPFINVQEIPGFREIAHRKLPCLPLKIINNPKLYMLNTNVYIILSCLISFISIAWTQAILFFIGTASHVFKTKAQSSRAFQMQKKFFKAMCIQIALPLVIIMVPGVYIIYALSSDEVDIALCNGSMIWVSSHGLFSTLVMLIAHKPYRNATLELLRFKKTDVSKSCSVFKQTCIRQ